MGIGMQKFAKIEITHDEKPIEVARKFARTNPVVNGVLPVEKAKTYQNKITKTYYYRIINGKASRLYNYEYSQTSVTVNWEGRYSAERLTESRQLAKELLGL